MDCSHLWKLYEEQKLVDCTIEGGKLSWKCHRVIVCAASPYLEKEFINNNTNTLRLPFISKVSNCFGELLPFLYDNRCECDIPLKYTLRLMVLAGLLGIKKIRDRIFNKIIQFTNKGPMESCAIATLLSDTWIKPKLNVISSQYQHINVTDTVKDLSRYCRLISDNCINIMKPFAGNIQNDIQPEVLMSLFQDSAVSPNTISKLIVTYVANKKPSSLPSEIFTQVRLPLESPLGSRTPINYPVSEVLEKEIESDCDIFQSTGTAASVFTNPSAAGTADSVVKIRSDLSSAISQLNGNIDQMKSQVSLLESFITNRINLISENINRDRDDSPELLDAQLSEPLPLLIPPSRTSGKSKLIRIEQLLADIAEDTQSSLSVSPCRKRLKE